MAILSSSRLSIGDTSADILSNKLGIYIQGRPVATSPRCKVEDANLGERESGIGIGCGDNMSTGMIETQR